MKDINKSLQSWLAEIEDFELTKYEKLPDIDLYMDQVITYLERQLMPFSLSSLDKPITSSMINNYVKGEVIKAPVSKRYNKEHISQILEVCLLKKALSISNIKKIMDAKYDTKEYDKVYNDFVLEAAKSLHDVAKKTSEAISKIEDGNDEKKLLEIALNLSLEANSNMLIAERILNYIRIKNDLK